MKSLWKPGYRGKREKLQTIPMNGKFPHMSLSNFHRPSPVRFRDRPNDNPKSILIYSQLYRIIMFLKVNLISFVAPKPLVLPMKRVYSVKAYPFTSMGLTVLMHREP